MSSQAWINLAYLAASMLFIVAFKLMTGPRTAVKGNYLGAVGMAIALIAACFVTNISLRSPVWVDAGTANISGFITFSVVLI